jgi:hypothetical protein
MPNNRFTDTKEKRELRRRDGRRLRKFAELLDKRLSYCGLPSVEFLDVAAWKNYLESVTAFENDQDAYEDMLIEWDKLNYPFPLTINPGNANNIFNFLSSSEYCFDLYNLDLFGGLVYTVKQKSLRTIDALRRMFSEQARCERSFILICTFNVRDAGASEYFAFLESARQELMGRPNSTENIRKHNVDQSTRMKLCFPYFCWQQAHANGFEHLCDSVVRYRSSTVMVHFFQVFRYKGIRLLPVASTDRLIELANQTLYEIKGQIQQPHVVFPQIS